MHTTMRRLKSVTRTHNITGQVPLFSYLFPFTWIWASNHPIVYRALLAFAGDTFKKKFKITSLRTTSTGQNSIFTIECQLFNQKDIAIFTCEKSMIFPFCVAPSEVTLLPTPFEKHNSLLNHLISEADALQNLGSHTLSCVRPGQLIFHNLQRPIPLSSSMQVVSLFSS